MEAIKMMSPKQAADALGVCRAFVYREIKSGRIAAHLVGGVLRIDPRELEKYLVRGKIKTKSTRTRRPQPKPTSTAHQRAEHLLRNTLGIDF